MSIDEALRQLGLTTTATESDVKQAYKDLARIWHPDRFQNDEQLGARTETQIKIINEARSVAMAYLEKHGHFLHVGRTQRKQSHRAAENKPLHTRQEPPKQEKPQPSIPKPTT